MKKLICTCIIILFFLGCIGQRYEVWAIPIQSNNTIRGNYVFSNDSVLMLYSNPKWFVPLWDIHFAWDDVTYLQIRNRSRNEAGIYIGAATGGLVAYVHYLSLCKPPPKPPQCGATVSSAFIYHFWSRRAIRTGILMWELNMAMPEKFRKGPFNRKCIWI